MAGYVSVRSNWSSVDSISLDLICDIDIEDRNQSTMMDKQDENHAQVDSRLVFFSSSIVLFKENVSVMLIIFSMHVLFEYDFFYIEFLCQFVEYR
jgi:hypothetical protein